MDLRWGANARTIQHMRLRALVLASFLGASASAAAQPVVHREGEYTGVSPGQVSEGQKPRRAPAKGTLSWIGFRAKDGGAELFFQSPAKFEVSQALEGPVLVVHLAGLSRQVANTRRPIDTRFFDNPLARITSRVARRGKRGKSGIELRIAFKNPKDARQGTLRTATEADGLFYAYLTFPEGAEPAPSPDDAATPDAKAGDN
jgi:hypothetical protein